MADVCVDRVIKRFSSVQGESGPDIESMLDLGICFKDWFLRSQTSFYGYDRFSLPWYFGLFCLNFSFGGLVMLLIRPKWIDKTYFPYNFMALSLLFVQGPLSFMADFKSMGKDSYFHVADRIFAVPLTFMELCKIVVMYRYTRFSFFLIYAGTFGFAIFSFITSCGHQSAKNIEAFTFWHNMWHMFPIFQSVISVFDVIIFPDENYATQKKIKDADSPVLSTILLNKLNDSKKIA